MGQKSFFNSGRNPSGMVMFLRVAKIQIGHKLKARISRQIHRNPWWCQFSHFGKHWTPANTCKMLPRQRILFTDTRNKHPFSTPFRHPKDSAVSENNATFLGIIRMSGLFASLAKKLYSWFLFYLSKLTAPTEHFSSSLGRFLVSLSPAAPTSAALPASLARPLLTWSKWELQLEPCSPSSSSLFLAKANTHPAKLSSGLTSSIDTPKLLHLWFIIKNNKNRGSLVV